MDSYDTPRTLQTANNNTKHNFYGKKRWSQNRWLSMREEDGSFYLFFSQKTSNRQQIRFHGTHHCTKDLLVEKCWISRVEVPNQSSKRAPTIRNAVHSKDHAFVFFKIPTCFCGLCLFLRKHNSVQKFFFLSFHNEVFF